ncbi:iron ABC transporter permease, partial [bacterium]|nr:iron ABC transporter permease [bacterium]
LLFLGGAVLAFVVRDLDVASLDEESARALGVDPVRARKLAFLGASLLTAGVVAVAGPVGFVGLIVPHAVRRLAGPDHRVVLPCSALGGAAFLVACDALARTALYPVELPINIVTSAIGCPTFIWILARRR